MTENKHAFGQIFPSPACLPPYAQFFDGIGGITFIANSSSVRPPAAISKAHVLFVLFR
jgi:hypothetical protein